jgi:Protein of unknown function (DUF3551)
MNKTISFALMVAAVAAVAVGATAIMSSTSAHADTPDYCYGGKGNMHCGYTSLHQCRLDAPNGRCYPNPNA